MEPVEIKSGPAEVIASGSVISFNGHPIKIVFGPADERLSLVLVFKKDDSSKFDLFPEVIENSLELTFLNMEDFVTSRPIMSGTLGDKKLYINLRMKTLQNSKDVDVLYTIYLSGDDAE